MSQVREDEVLAEDDLERDVDDYEAPPPARRSGTKRGSNAGLLGSLASLMSLTNLGSSEQDGDQEEEEDEEEEEEDSGDSENSFYTRDGSTRETFVDGQKITSKRKLTDGVWSIGLDNAVSRERLATYTENFGRMADDIKDHFFAKPQDVSAWILGVVRAPDSSITDRDPEHIDQLISVLRNVVMNTSVNADERLQLTVAASMLIIRLQSGVTGAVLLDPVSDIVSKLVDAFKAAVTARSKETKKVRLSPVASGVAASALAYVMTRASDPRSMRDYLDSDADLMLKLMEVVEALDPKDDTARCTVLAPCLHLADFMCSVRPFLVPDKTKKLAPILAAKLPDMRELDSQHSAKDEEEDVAYCKEFTERVLGFPAAVGEPSSTIRVLSHSITVLSTLCEGADDMIEFVSSQPHVLETAKSLLSHKALRVYMPSLRLLGNVVAGEEEQLTQNVIDLNALPTILKFVEGAPSAAQGDELIPLYKESLWLVSNVLAGSRDQISYVLNLSAMPLIVDVLAAEAAFSPLKTEALWCARNALAGGSVSHAQTVLDAGTLEALVPILSARLSSQDSILCAEAISEALRTLQEFAAEDETAGAPKYEAAKTRLRECEGVDVLDRCGCGGEMSADVTRLAQGILRTHFGMNNADWVDLDRQNRMFNFGGFSASDTFGSLGEAVGFWREKANEGLEEDSEDFFDELTLDPYVSQDNVRGVLVFLSKLRISQEFQNTSMQVGLARRVMEALETLCADEFAREEIIARMVDSVDSCGDKPIWALNQISLVSHVAHARGDKEKLREVGRGVMNLGIVHEHVRRTIDKIIRRQGGVDDVCVYLRFEIDLREDLDLPVSAQEMIYGTYVSIEKADIDAARKECNDVDDEAFEAWLAAWPEWVREERREFAEGAAWADLDQEELTRNSLRDSLTNLFGDPVEDPVRLLDPGAPGKRPVWSLKDLMTHWVATGMDLHNVLRSTDEMRDNLRRCTRRKSLRSMLSFKLSKSSKSLTDQRPNRREEGEDFDEEDENEDENDEEASRANLEAVH